ncbi:class E sortase [Pseudofrankia sp. DC12]|uniref:class E sortase n=1 Tax=Pseudofrankia sp. DC12 TaxID=683315 RepID=UPI000696EA37|nr:class E sortase [Pseudofrankia sp. DC12]
MAGAADGDQIGEHPAGRLAEPGLASRVPRQADPLDGDRVAPAGSGAIELSWPAPAAAGDVRPAAASAPSDQPTSPSPSPSPSPVPPAPGGRPGGARTGGAVVRGVGELLITLGLVVALFLAYELWITDIFQARTQSRLHNKLAATWAAPARPATPAPPPPAAPLHPAVGDGFAELHIPRLGAGYAPVIVEGVGEAQLQEGPGHYPGTAMPGEIGNFVVSGHRTTYGKPFNELDELRPGDPVVVEVSDRYYVYRMTRSEVVAPTRLDVTYPVPEQAGKAPTAAVMTMTTCNPKYSARTRLIVFAKLDKTVMKAPGVGVPFEPGEG